MDNKIKVSGTVELDEQSYMEIYNRIRHDVIIDVCSDMGLCPEYFMEYLSALTPKVYFHIVKGTISNICEKIDDDSKMCDVLQAINRIIHL